MSFPASVTFSSLSILLSLFFVFLLYFLYPLVKDNRIYSLAHVQKQNYVTLNGRVIDLHRATRPRLQQLHSKYKGTDISSLVPSFLPLARAPVSNSKRVYSDKDINTCVNDALIADSWLMNLVNVINGTKILFKNGTLEKCMDPLRKVLVEDCILSEEDINELFSLTVGALEIDKKVLETGNRVMENSLVAIDNRVFDVTPYLTFATFYNGEEENRAGQLPSPRSGDTMFLPENVTMFFLHHMGQSPTFSKFKSYTQLKNPDVFLRCFRILFFIGKINNGPFEDLSLDDNWILLISSVLVSFLIVLKLIIASIYRIFMVPSSLTAASTSSYIISVPFFNEPLSVIQSSMSRILSSELPGGQALLFVVCDGNVQSQGDIKETHRVVLDHLNHPWYQCPGEAINYFSLGEGEKRNNRARIFHGTFSNSQGLYLPYIVLAKIGGPWESYVSKPGTRGKRDSMLLLLTFLATLLDPKASLSECERYLLHTFEQLHLDPRSMEYLINVDGDVLVEPRNISDLVQQMMLEPNLAACFGTYSAQHSFASIPCMLETFHLFWSKLVLRCFDAATNGSSQVNTALACYRLQAHSNTSKHNNINEKKKIPDPKSNSTLWALHPDVVAKFGAKSLSSLLTKNLYYLGEDYLLAPILLKSHPNSKIRFLPSVEAYLQLPTDFFNFLYRLKKEWILQLFVSISILTRYQSSTLFQRCYALCGILWKLTTPVILATGYTMLAFMTSPFVMYALLVWAGVAAFFFLGLFCIRRFDIAFLFLLHLIFGLPLHMFLVPILGLFGISSVKWADQWPMSQYALERSPGPKWDPVLENLSSTSSSTFDGSEEDELFVDSKSLYKTQEHLRQRKMSRTMSPLPISNPVSKSSSPKQKIRSEDALNRLSRPDSQLTVLSDSHNSNE